MKDDLIYLDFNATTPVLPAALEAMLPWFSARFGNASSTHAHGREAADAVAHARSVVAEALGVQAATVVFTSGATEANNIALRGAGRRVVVPSTEHKAVLETARSLEHAIVPVFADGRVDLDALEAAAARGGLVSVMLANNETGVIQDLPAVVEIARSAGCLVHTDATQAFGKVSVDLGALDVDFASVSAHKVYGPKGVGALYVRRGVGLAPILTGGGHERGLRSGTLNVPGIVGFGVAASNLDFGESAGRQRKMVDQLLSAFSGMRSFQVFSDHHRGLPNTLSIRFDGADAEAVMANCPALCISTGSACTAAVPEPSHVLLAMGIPASDAFQTLRISVGRCTTSDEIDRAARAIVAAVERVRSLTGPDCEETS